MHHIVLNLNRLVSGILSFLHRRRKFCCYPETKSRHIDLGWKSVESRSNNNSALKSPWKIIRIILLSALSPAYIIIKANITALCNCANIYYLSAKHYCPMTHVLGTKLHPLLLALKLLTHDILRSGLTVICYDEGLNVRSVSFKIFVRW